MQAFRNTRTNTVNRLIVTSNYIFKILIEYYSMLTTRLVWLFALLLVIPPAWSQDKEIDPDGYNVFYYPNGEKSSEGHFEGGRPNGFWKTYYENGKLKSEGNRKDFELDSLWKFYREDGALLQEINYVESKRQGFTFNYNEEGLLTSKMHYDSDTLEGKSFFYYPEERKVQFEKPYGNGMLQGIGYEFALDGRITGIITYDKGVIRDRESINRIDPKGQQQGLWIEFYEDQEERSKRLEGRYRNDLKNGYFREYDRQGLLLGTTKYVNGMVVENAEELRNVEIERTYHDNATVRWEKSYLGGQPHGVWKEYNDTGAVVNSIIYKNGVMLGEGIIDDSGIKQGPWKEYYRDGTLRAEGIYKDGARYKGWRFYHPNSKLEQKGSYLDGGVPHGQWKWFYATGQLLREEMFRRGKEDGEVIEYDSVGNEVLKGFYIDGLEDGTWFIEMGEYREEGEYIEGLRQGEWRHYYTSNDELSFKGKYVEGLANGKHTYYYDTGKKMLEGRYQMGEKEGDWKRYNPDGTLMLTIEYQAGYDKRIDGKKVKPETSAAEELE